MDLFLEIAPVADFSASCYWQLTKVSHVALDYARPIVSAFVEKRNRLRRRSASNADVDGPATSLPALKSALFNHSSNRDLSSSDSSNHVSKLLDRTASDALLRRLSDPRLRSNNKSALHW